LGPVFARLESRPIMKWVMRGGFVDTSRLPDDFIAELRRSGSRQGYARVGRAIYRSLKGFTKSRDRYRDVQVPVTLVYGEHDWSRKAERDQVARLLTDVECVTLPDTGHFSALERPADMARILLRQTREGLNPKVS
jgi:pimeloyl-ACP methyl ester carboxylesterase